MGNQSCKEGREITPFSPFFPTSTLLLPSKKCQGERIDTLVKRIEQLPAILPEPGAARSIPAIEADYFRFHAQRMCYPTFRAQGMQIGSGVAEAACKTVVSTRAKRAGMRWTPQGLDAVLALRVAVLNGTYGEFWKQRPHLVA